MHSGRSLDQNQEQCSALCGTGDDDHAGGHLCSCLRTLSCDMCRACVPAPPFSPGHYMPGHNTNVRASPTGKSVSRTSSMQFTSTRICCARPGSCSASAARAPHCGTSGSPAVQQSLSAPLDAPLAVRVHNWKGREGTPRLCWRRPIVCGVTPHAASARPRAARR